MVAANSASMALGEAVPVFPTKIRRRNCDGHAAGVPETVRPSLLCAITPLKE